MADILGTGGARDIISVVSSAVVDLNQPSLTLFSHWDTDPVVLIDPGAEYELNANGVDLPRGSYLASLNVELVSSGTRNNAFASFCVDYGQGAGPEDIPRVRTRACSAYIRNTGGHNESSLHLAEVPVVLADPARLSFWYQQAGTVNTALNTVANGTVMTLRRLW